MCEEESLLLFHLFQGGGHSLVEALGPFSAFPVTDGRRSSMVGAARQGLTFRRYAI